MEPINMPAQMDLRDKYGDKLYTVAVGIEVDDFTTERREYIFRKPSTMSYDRLINSTQNSPSRANKDFVLDNIVEEQLKMLEADLEEYPALSMTIGNKLLGMMGLSKDASVKKLIPAI